MRGHTVIVQPHDLAQTTRRGDNYRTTIRHRLQRYDPERLIQTRERGDIGDVEQSIPLLVGDEAREVHIC